MSIHYCGVNGFYYRLKESLSLKNPTCSFTKSLILQKKKFYMSLASIRYALGIR
jgi:hypothetical protein